MQKFIWGFYSLLRKSPLNFEEIKHILVNKPQAAQAHYVWFGLQRFGRNILELLGYYLMPNNKNLKDMKVDETAFKPAVGHRVAMN